ncbi:hypothetical protein [Kribbella albertanoniae]|uniref:hypothetical protein n=1 Tax=Kribbella albertanoniae TaxID=1266829 RepID=UPI0014048072|nr:hypothetical protein [Kribbella albertanoniae]
MSLARACPQQGHGAASAKSREQFPGQWDGRAWILAGEQSAIHLDVRCERREFLVIRAQIGH